MSDLGPMPEPAAEPREPEPGGPDAVDAEANDEASAEEAPSGRDLAPGDNPAADDVPEEVTEPDTDKQQAPASDESADKAPGEDPPIEPSA